MHIGRCSALIEREAGELGLVLNHKKSEIITNNLLSRSSILAQMLDALVLLQSALLGLSLLGMWRPLLYPSVTR